MSLVWCIPITGTVVALWHMQHTGHGDISASLEPIMDPRTHLGSELLG